LSSLKNIFLTFLITIPSITNAERTVQTADEIVHSSLGEEERYNRIFYYIHSAKKFYYKGKGLISGNLLYNNTMSALSHISAEIEALKKQVQVLSDSHLNSAIISLNNATLLKSEAEKLDSIRSAKRSLTQAITIEKDLSRKLYAIYLLGQVFTLLGEVEAAGHNFESVVMIPFDKTLMRSLKYSPLVHQLKKEASAYLCSFNSQPKATEDKDKWCAYYLAYLSVKKDNINEVEQCINADNSASCNRVADTILPSYVDPKSEVFLKKLTGKKYQTQGELLTRFNPLSTQDINTLKYLIRNPCYGDNVTLSTLSIKRCLWQSQIAIHNKDNQKAKDHLKYICDQFLLDSDQFEEAMSIGVSACNSLLHDTIWREITSSEKDTIHKMCMQLNTYACHKILSQGNLFHKDIIKTLKFVAHRCLVTQSEDYCSVIETLNKEDDYSKLTLKHLTIGLKKDNKLWDLSLTGRRGSDKPDIQLEVYLQTVPLIHCRLSILQTKTDKNDKPSEYIVDPGECASVPFSRSIANTTPFLIKIKDIDTSSDDIVGEHAVLMSELNQSDLSFGSVLKLTFEIKKQ